MTVLISPTSLTYYVKRITIRFMIKSFNCKDTEKLFNDKDVRKFRNISRNARMKREISADTTLRLGKYFGIEPEFWLYLQVRFNMKIAREKTGKTIEKEVKKFTQNSDNTVSISA